MFTIVEEENEPLTERAKVDELLTKVPNSGPVAAVAQFRYQLNTLGILFTVAANHLNSEISQTPDYQLLRKINATNTNASGRGNGGCSGSGRGGLATEDEAVLAEEELARKQHIIRRRSGKSYRTRNEIKSGMSEIKRASREEPSKMSPK